MLAAQGIVISLSVMIEAPVINLLATSTAVVKDRPSYLLVRKFTLHWAALLTFITILIAFTPLFDVVVSGLLGAPPEVARWVEPGMKIMTFWSAAIAWRRFLQGVMIHFNQTSKVAWGTAIRLITSAGTVILLATRSNWPGVIIGSTALMVGVIAEAIYATIAVRPILHNELSPTAPTVEGEPLTYRELFWFHLPLAGTSVLILLAQPLVTFSLARLDNPTLSLAAWPVLFQIILIARAAALALPEVIIALTKASDTFQPLRQFSFSLAAIVTLFMALFTLTPASNFYIFVIQDTEPLVGQLVKSALVLFLFYPALATFISWLRGLLINRRATKEVNWGMGINLLITVVILAIGLVRQAPGLHTAAVALNVAALAEVIYLAWRTQHILPISSPLFDLRRLEIGDWRV